MPAVPERIFLVNPVTFDGPDREGSTASISPDASRSIPVVVVGPAAPRAGELIIVQSCGGRWVSEYGGKPGSVPCGGCDVPRANLTLTLTNGLLGTRSTTMTFDGVDGWETGCIGQIVFRLKCRAGAMSFTAAYFVAGSCPTGQVITCVGQGTSPLGLALTNRSCDPFLLQYTAASCPTLAAQGYTKFTVTL